MRKTIIAIVGKTNSGKDTLAKHIQERFGVPSVVSYTTRPIREGEVDGVQHHFITEEEMEELKAKSNLVAYTKNEETGIQYCATEDSLPDGNAFVYIINPEGIHWFNENYKGDNIDLYMFYMDCPEDVLRERAAKRGDNMEVFEKRLTSERDEMDTFKAEGDALIIDATQSLEDIYAELDVGLLLLLNRHKVNFTEADIAELTSDISED